MQVTLRFHGRLNDFLPKQRRETTFALVVDGAPAIKDTLESVGVPHPEIARIVVNDAEVDAAYTVCDGDVIVVYPPEQPIDLFRAAQGDLRPRFVADVHLGRLAAYLRILGFDTVYSAVDLADPYLADVAHREARILLTRDLGLLKRKVVMFGYFVRTTAPMQQLGEIVERYDLLHYGSQALRCTQCNGALEIVAKDEVAAQLTAQTLNVFDEFRRCTACGKVYWRGSHYDRIERYLDGLRDG
jgi:uncharacterized protein